MAVRCIAFLFPSCVLVVVLPGWTLLWVLTWSHLWMWSRWTSVLVVDAVGVDGLMGVDNGLMGVDTDSLILL